MITSQDHPVGETKRAGTPPSLSESPSCTGTRKGLNRCLLSICPQLQGGIYAFWPHWTRHWQAQGGIWGWETHLTLAGLPLPAQVAGLLLQPLHLLGVSSSGLLELGPEVPQFRRQGIHGALGQKGLVLWCPLTLPQATLSLLAELSTFRSKQPLPLACQAPARSTTPSKCCGCSWSLPWTRGLSRAKPCVMSLTRGFPKEGLNLPQQAGQASPPDGLPTQEALLHHCTNPVLLLPALCISLLPLHLQGDGSQAVLGAHELLGQRCLLRLLQGQGLGRGKEQRAGGLAGPRGIAGLSPTLPGRCAHRDSGAQVQSAWSPLCSPATRFNISKNPGNEPEHGPHSPPLRGKVFHCSHFYR